MAVNNKKLDNKISKIMKNKTQSIACLIGAFVSFASHALYQEADPAEGIIEGLTPLTIELNNHSYEKVSADFQPLTHNLAGETYDVASGSVIFQRVDANLPGNFDIEVAYRTKYSTGITSYTGWEEDIPRIELEAISDELSEAWANKDFCNGDQSFPSITGEGSKHDEQRYEQKEYSSNIYTSGPMLIVPGKTSAKLLKNISNKLTTGDYPFVTKDKWRLTCFTNTQGNNGFKATSPEGITYTFDKYSGGSAGGTVDDLNTRIEIGKFKYHKLRFNLYVSKIEDRFGNYVDFTYYYNSSRIKGIEKISSSDGRELSVSIQDSVKTVTTGDRNWKYYTDASTGLYTVERPDEKKWTYDLGHVRSNPSRETRPDPCDVPDKDFNKFDMSVTHPDGATVQFDFAFKIHGRIKASGLAVEDTYEFSRYGSKSSCSRSLSLISKTVNAGSASYTWNFDYSQRRGYHGEFPPVSLEGGAPPLPLLGDLPDNIDATVHKTTTMTNPDGSKVVYYINRDASSLFENKIEAVEYIDSTDVVLKEEQSAFVKGIEYGVAIVTNIDGFSKERQEPLLSQQKVTLFSQQEVTTLEDEYTTDYEYNQTYGGLEGKVESFTSGIAEEGTRTLYSKFTYHQNTEHWQLNLPEKSFTSFTKDSFSTTPNQETSYYEDTHEDYEKYAHLPYREKSFGVWQKEYSSYTTEGYLSEIKFNEPLVGSATGGNRYVNYSNYKRGIARNITAPARTDTKLEALSLVRSVDDYGQVTSVTDLNGNTTEYSYDLNGRIKSMSSPSRVSGDWLDAFFSVTYDGENSSYPKRTIQRCKLNIDKTGCEGAIKHQSVTIYDFMLRPMKKETRDVANNTSVYQTFEFDSYNNQTFVSLPSYSVNTSTGETRTYDPLQRLKTVSQSNGGTVTYEYLPGNKISVEDAGKNTNDVKHTTTTTFLAYGSPTYQQAIYIASPEQVNTTISVNQYNQISSITQSGKRVVDDTEQDITVTEYHLYDSAQQLCQISRDDVGTTVFERNKLGQVTWQAQGQTAENYDSCISTVIDSDKVTFSYDNLGSLSKTTYGDSTAERSYSYDGNGNLETISNGIYTQSYQYNSLNTLEFESLEIDGKTFTLDYRYDDLGNLAGIIYPDGQPEISFSPNGFGQATGAMRVYTDESVDRFANQASYYANGSVDTFTYGNGVVHKTHLNNRQIPSQIQDDLNTKSIVDLSYLYDNNLNVTKITNAVENGYSLSELTYDGLNRLLTTTGGAAIGSSELSYDGLGNIVSYTNDSATKPHNYTYTYDSSNRLEKVAQADGTFLYDFSNSSSYDERGNILNKNGVALTYNLANQMTSATGNSEQGSLSNSYVYDGYDRRIKTVKENGDIEYSMYSQSGQLLYRETKDGGINYIFLGSKLIAKEGTGIKATNSAKNETSIAHYKPFGENLEKDSDGVGYTGHKFDTDLGLSYMQARYYDPVIGRFYSNDPVGFTNVHTFNRYAYANNNPYKYIDPDGRSAKLARSAFNVVRDASRNGWDFKKASKGEIDGWVDNAVTLGDGQFTHDDVFAVIDVFTGFGGESKDLANSIQKFFKKSVPSNARDTVTARSLPNGGVAVQATSDGKVPGSSAVYEKQIGANGQTIQNTKTVYLPDGGIDTVKEKTPGGQVFRVSGRIESQKLSKQLDE